MTQHEAERPLFITVEEAARQIGIGRALAFKLIREGRIPSVKLGAKRMIPADVPRKLLQQAYDGAVAERGGATHGS